MSRYLAFPLRFSPQGGLRLTADPDQHMRDRILAVLFTARGERVLEPGFGVGVDRLVFEGISATESLRFEIAVGLRRDMGDDFVLEDVEIRPVDQSGELGVHIVWRRRTEQFLRALEVRL